MLYVPSLLDELNYVRWVRCNVGIATADDGKHELPVAYGRTLATKDKDNLSGDLGRTRDSLLLETMGIETFFEDSKHVLGYCAMYEDEGAMAICIC